MVFGDTFRVLIVRSVLYQHLKTKHEEWKVRARLRATVREGTNVSRWLGQEEIQRGNKATIASLNDELGREIKGQKQIGEAFHGDFT